MNDNYDNAKYQVKRAIVLADPTGISVVGTNASDTEMYRIRLARATKIEDIDLVAMTGGTAAGPYLLFGKSLAGTGAVVNFGTSVFGTAADNAAEAVTVAETDFADGDHLVVSRAAGTAAATLKVTINIGWREDFDTTN